MRLHDYLDRSLLKDEILERYVRVQSHPDLPYNILNYTNKAQIEGHWSDVTRKCRGLIYNVNTEQIVAMPFQKFFNNNQPEAPAWALWDEKHVTVRDKMDGSLGILYHSPGQPMGYAVATRGSFTSDQALWATELLNTRYRHWTPILGRTYLVEIIYPQNRIVVNYEGLEDLVLLDILSHETGKSVLRWHQQNGYHCPFPVAETFTYADITEDRANAEGYVLHNWRTNERVKIKFEEYKRLHKLLTGISEKTIWELLSKGESLHTVLDTVPDEFYDWVKKTADNLHVSFDRIFETCWQGYLKARAFHGDDRKEFALYIKDSEFKDILFGFYDNKDVGPAIWKRLKPAFSKPFWNVDEDSN